MTCLRSISIAIEHHHHHHSHRQYHSLGLTLGGTHHHQMRLQAKMKPLTRREVPREHANTVEKTQRMALGWRYQAQVQRLKEVAKAMASRLILRRRRLRAATTMARLLLITAAEVATVWKWSRTDIHGRIHQNQPQQVIPRQQKVQMR